MRSRVVALFACLASGAEAGAQASARDAAMQHERAVVREVLATSRLLDRALQERDTTTLSKIYANGYVHIDQFGVRSTKQQRLAELGSGARQFNSMGAVVEERIVAFGDVIVTTAKTNGQQTLNGQAVRSGPRLSTRVWVHQAGRWQVILAQVTPIVTDARER